jgi:hypothetical protein
VARRRKERSEMNNQKLILWIRMNDEVVDKPNWSCNMVNSEDLIKAIRNGEFDKEPCDSCGYYEKFNQELSEDEQYKWNVFCRKCGRKLEETK